MFKPFILLIATLLIWGSVAFAQVSGTDLDPVKEELKKTLASDFFENLYAKTYHSLLDRMGPDGYMPESLTGAYQGMFPRTIGAYVLLLIETGRYAEAESSLNFVLNVLDSCKMEYVPRIVGKDDKGSLSILDDQFQIDAQAHVILGWARLALKRGRTSFEDRTWSHVKQLMERTCSRPFFQRGHWAIEPGLVRNIAFEHSKEGRMWDVWDLLTQSFVGAAMTDMAIIADRRGEQQLGDKWSCLTKLLKKGIKEHMVTTYYGVPTYLEMYLPSGGQGNPYNGLGWVTLSPVAAGWEGAGHEILKNTVAVMNKKILKRSNGVAWMPTDGYPDGHFSNEIIGKGIAWEMDFAREEQDYSRLQEIFHLIRTVNNAKPIYMEGAWLEGNGIRLSAIISDSDLNNMATSVWKVKDAGNGEQTAWWCWAMARLRKSFGLSVDPISNPSAK